VKNLIKWGIIGSCGIAKRRTIPEGIVKAKNVILVAVYDIDLAANEDVARQFNAKAAKNLEELLASDIDAVYIASPVNRHIDHVKAAAKAKKHILCEKPMGLNVGEAEEMVQICQEEGVTFGIAYMMRFVAQHLAALELITQGKIGKPVFCRAQLSCWYPPIQGAWRQDPLTSGGGSLMDMGSHCIDLLELFFGKVKRVQCFTQNLVHDYPVEDSAVVTLVFENGAMGTVDCCFCIPDNSSKNVLELYGSKGSIVASGTIGQASFGEMVAYLENDDTAYNALQARSNSEGIVINPIPKNTYCAEIEEFSRALLEGREPFNSFSIGMRNQKILSACYESANTGKIIEIN